MASLSRWNSVSWVFPPLFAFENQKLICDKIRGRMSDFAPYFVNVTLAKSVKNHCHCHKNCSHSFSHKYTLLFLFPAGIFFYFLFSFCRQVFYFLVYQYCNQNYCALYNVCCMWIYVHKRQDIIDNTHNHCTNYRRKDESNAAA